MATKATMATLSPPVHGTTQVNDNMSEGSGVKAKVQLPRVPTGKRPKSAQEGTQDAFWNKQGSSGAHNANRQLNTTRHKGGRKQNSLPGGKLQPLFKNFSAPPPGSKIGNRKNVLPGISPPTAQGDDDSATVHGVVCGRLDQLPEASPSTVRVYLASNFPDMAHERSAILERGVPDIQTFCMNQGFHFQLVDLHWGLSFDASDSFGTSAHQRRKQEIRDCQRLSLGPNFVALVGDLYGSQSVLREIPSSEFDILLSVIKAQKEEAAQLVLNAYKEDVNAKPSAYVLQRSEVGGHEDEILDVIVNAARQAHAEEKLTDASLKKYIMSDLEEDIRSGILDVLNPRNHCLAYHREWRHLATQVESSGVATFIDMKGSKVDAYKQEMQKEMATELASYLGAGNHRQYFVSWDDQHVVDNNAEFKEYLNQLVADFVADVKHLVAQAIQREKFTAGGKQEVYSEVLHHAAQLNEKAACVYGQTELLQTALKFVDGASGRPFLVHGPSGAGKTAVMAKLAQQLQEKNERCVVVFRVLGSSSASSGIHSTVLSITEQICQAYCLKMTLEGSTLFQALTDLRSVLEEVSVTHATLCPLFILLDGLDKLQPQDESLRSLWAMKNLPVNVHMVVSTVAQQGEVHLVDALLTLVTDEEASMQVQDLSNADLDQLIDGRLRQSRRTVTSLQKEAIVQTYHVQGNPHLLDLYLRLAVHWPSFQTEQLPFAGDGVSSLLLNTLQRLEAEVGSNTVSYFVAYLTAVPLGVHERELLDLMSLNSDVMQEVSSIHGMEEELQLFPPSLLSLLKHTLRPFLAEHFVHSHKLLAWTSRECLEAVAARYQVIFPGVPGKAITEDSTNLTLTLHEHMANMYLGDAHNDFLSEHSSATDLSSLLMPQPLLQTNQLKLHRLPLHMKVLLPLQGAGRICQVLFFNFEWMMTKVQASQVQDLKTEVLGILQLQRQMESQGIGQDEGENIIGDLELLLEFLQMTESVLLRDPQFLVTEVAARLPALSDSSVPLKLLVDGAMEWAGASEQPRLLPLCPCMLQPGGPLRHVLKGPTHFVGPMHASGTGVMFSQRNGTEIWQMETGELQQRFRVHKEQDVDNVIVGKVADFVIIGHFSYVQQLMELSVWSSETGVRLLQSTFPHKFTAIALTSDDTMLMVATVVESSDTQLTRCLLGVDVHSKEIKFSLPTVDAHSDAISKMIFLSKQPERLLTLGTLETKDLALWDLNKEEVVFRVQLPHYPNLLRESDGEVVVAACSVEGVLTLVDLKRGEITATISESALIYLRDFVVVEDCLLVATEQSGVLKFCLRDGSPMAPHIALPSGWKPSVMVTLTNQFLFVGFDSGLIRLLHMESGEFLTDLEGHSARVNSLDLLQNKWLISAGNDEQALVWNLLHLKKRIEERAAGADEGVMTEDVACTLTSSDEIFTAHPDGDVKAWDVETGKIKRTLSKGGCEGVCDLYWAYKGKILVGHGAVTGRLDVRQLLVWKVETGELLKFDDGEVFVFCSCVFPGPQDRLLAISPVADSNLGGISLAVYDLCEMKSMSSLHCSIYGDMNAQNLVLKGFTRYEKPESAVFSSAGQRGIKRSNKQKAKTERLSRLYAVLDYCPQPGVSFFFNFIVEGEERSRICMEHNEPLHLDTLNHECSQLLLTEGSVVSGCMDGTLNVWDVATQAIITQINESSKVKTRRKPRPAHTGPVTCVAVSQDGSVLASGGIDQCVRVWMLNSKQLLHVLSGHSDQISCVALAPDGQWAVSSSQDKDIMLWSSATGQKLTTYHAHHSATKLHLLKDKMRIVIQMESSKPQLSILSIINA